jgi:hypothetical protein
VEKVRELFLQFEEDLPLAVFRNYRDVSLRGVRRGDDGLQLGF